MSETDWNSLIDGLSSSSALVRISPDISKNNDINGLGNLSIGPNDVSVGASTTNNHIMVHDGRLCRLVHQSSRTLIYRCRSDIGSDEGIKIVLDPSAAQERTLLLENERRIVNYLPKSYPKRKIIKVETMDDGRLAINFDWVDGITLEDWLKEEEEQRAGQDSTQKPEEVLRTRLSVAIAITIALHDCHEAGVAHKSLSPSNIILESLHHNSDGNKKYSGAMAASLIDLSKSVVMKECKDEHSAEMARKSDLRALGQVFQVLFGANEGLFDKVAKEEKSCSDEYYITDRTKRARPSTGQEENDVPLFLVALILGLVNIKDGNAVRRDVHNNGEQYEHAKDVLSDLKAASNNFDTYFRKFDWKDASVLKHLSLPSSAFYGRKTEMSILMNSLHSVLNYGQPVMTAVTGNAGCGKTLLVNQVKKNIEERNGHMIVAKFHMVDGSRSDNVLFEALDSFFGNVVDESDADSKAQMRERIANAVRFGIGDLIHSIPNLGKLFLSTSHDKNIMKAIDTEGLGAISKQQLLHRSKFLLCKLIGAIANSQSPLVLAFDDMQWADKISLSIIQTIITDPDISHCLYVGSYRDDDEIGAQNVVPIIDEVRKQGLRLFTICLKPFARETVNEIVSHSLCLPPILAQPLSAAVHTISGGCPHFLFNFIRDGTIIRFNLQTRRWEYDIQSILTREIPPVVVQYLKKQMTKMPQSYCLVLKLAACLGDQFNQDTFLKARIRSDCDLDKVLPSVCRIGFIHEIKPGVFVWSHDQFRQAAYELIPEHMREQFHMLIGTRLLCNTSTYELERGAIFDILCHMNKGIGLIQDCAQKYEVARLNLMAGEACLKNSSFHSAGDYFTHGIKLLPKGCWECEYSLTLNLHDAAQEALYITGDFTALRQLCDEVIVNAKTHHDKLNACNNIVRLLVSLDKIEEAVSTCKSVLSEIGEPLPQVTNEACYTAMVTTKSMLASYTRDEILTLKRMTDKNKLAAMEFNQCILLSVFNSPDPRMGVLLVTTLIQLSLEHGLSEASPFAFAMYSTILTHGNMKDLEGSYFYGNIAIKLLPILGASRYKSRVFTMIYGLVNIWRDPFQASLDNLLEAHRVGCLSDIEYAFRSAHMYSELAFFTGQDLRILQNVMKTYVKRALQCKQVGAELAIMPYLAAALDLIGDSKKEDIYQDILNTTEEALFRLLESRNDRRVSFSMLNSKKLLHIFRDDMEKACEAYQSILNHPIISLNIEHIRSMPNIMGAFSDALIAFSCARKSTSERQKWSKKGEEILSLFKEWCSISSWNFSNKMHLIEAEYYFLHQNDMALEKYEASIASAKSHRFVHEEGLAYCLLGKYHLASGRIEKSKQSFLEAKRCYGRWGASALVSQLDDLLLT